MYNMKILPTRSKYLPDNYPKRCLWHCGTTLIYLWYANGCCFFDSGHPCNSANCVVYFSCRFSPVGPRFDNQMESSGLISPWPIFCRFALVQSRFLLLAVSYTAVDMIVRMYITCTKWSTYNYTSLVSVTRGVLCDSINLRFMYIAF